MAVVDITIKNRIASAPAGVELVCNNPTDTIHFNFDEEWNGVNEKTARFSWEGKYVEVSFIGDSVKVPEIYKTDYVFVGVYGVQIASTPVKVQCKRSILCYGDTVRAPLTDPFYEEFCDRINAAEEKVSEMQEVIDSTYTYLEDGGSPLNIPGNAGTATKLHTPVKIGDASFDGSTDVTLSDMGAVGYSEQDFSDEAKAQARANIDAAKASHAHGSITNDGKLGTVSGRIITTGTGGKMQASTAESARTMLELAKVATSGSYTDLSDKPSVDTVVTTDGANAVSGAAVAKYVKDIEVTVADRVTDTETYPVSGAAVAAYVSDQLAAILNFEEVAF